MPNFLQIATALIEKGFSVIPIEPRGKRPVPGLGALSRTRDLAVVGAWAEQWPDANVAICADEDTVILETDDYRKLDEVLLLGCGRGFLGLSTLMACGSSENRPHLFFKRTEKATNVGNLVVPGLFEARFNNQYVVGPGSVHPSGSVYHFLNDVPMVPIPDWLVSELARLALAQKTSGVERRVDAVGGRIPEGSRHYFLMRELGKCWTGRETEEELNEKADELNQLCDPPKDTAHVRQCVRDIMRREPYSPGPQVIIGSARHASAGPGGAWLGEACQGEDGMGGSIPPSPIHWDAKPPAPEVEVWEPMTARALKTAEIPPRQVIMAEDGSPLFYEASVNQVVAWRGVGKTQFGIGLATAIAQGGEILKFKTDRPRRVLYIDGELPKAQLQERVRGLVPPEHDDNILLFGPEFLPKSRGLNLISNHDFSALYALIEKHGIEVLFIDSQSTTMKGDSLESKFQEDRQSLLRNLRWMNLCVVEMHHEGKGGLQRGSSKNDDILDVQIKLKRLPDWEPSDGLAFEIVYEKIRHAAHLETGYVVELRDGVWGRRPSDEVHAAAEIFNKDGTNADVAKALKVSRTKAQKLRQKAIAANLVKPAVEVKVSS